eukprot:759124-Hanusia_phi.AAC.1
MGMRGTFVMEVMLRTVAMLLRTMPLRWTRGASWFLSPFTLFWFFRRSRVIPLQESLRLVERYLRSRVEVAHNFNINRIAIASCFHVARAAASLLHLPLWEEDHQLCETDSGLEELRQHYRGGSVMVVSAHFGYWELLVPFLNKLLDVSAQNKQVGIVYKPLHDVHVDLLLQDIRLSDVSYSDRCWLIPTGGSKARLRQVLEGGGLVGLLPDQRCSSGDVVECSFLGRQTSCHAGFARLYAEVDACKSLWFVVCRDSNGVFDIVARKIHQKAPAWSEAIHVEKLVQLYNQYLEAEVLRSPEQYFWLHNRWKHKSKERS